MIYNKYKVEKREGKTDPTAEYFVLRVDTDKAARYAVRSYALCLVEEDEDNRPFAKQLIEWVDSFDEDRE